MKKSVFNTKHQQKDIASKIVVGFERISETFRALLWDYAKVIGLSPIQIQILIFVAYHKEELCNVSHLAKEFNVTKPTISDAIKVLKAKGLVEKEVSSLDNRSYVISVSDAGKSIVANTEGFTDPIKSEIDKMDSDQLEGLYGSLNTLIYRLNRIGILSVQRTCYGCRFYELNTHGHFCHFLNKKLLNRDIRLDCPEFEIMPSSDGV